MATTYTSFQNYPLEIAQITSEYNPRIAAIESFILSDLEYSGDEADLVDILPYFIFWYFCQREVTTITAKTGENLPIQKTSVPEIYMQVQNWNTGVKKMRDLFGITDEKLNDLTGMTNGEKIHQLVLASGKKVNEKYLSKRSLL